MYNDPTATHLNRKFATVPVLPEENLKDFHGLMLEMAGLTPDEPTAAADLKEDCLAGLWAHHANRSRQILETGDVEEALTAASAIGDDRLQRRSSGHVTPDSFTHGSSAQRTRWFKRGLESGKFSSCDTFSVTEL